MVQVLIEIIYLCKVNCIFIGISLLCLTFNIFIKLNVCVILLSALTLNTKFTDLNLHRKPICSLYNGQDQVFNTICMDIHLVYIWLPCYYGMH